MIWKKNPIHLTYFFAIICENLKMMYKKVIHTHRLFNCVILDLRMVKNSNLISIWLAFLKCVGWTKTSAVIYLSTTWYINTCWYKWLVIYYELIMVILTFTNLLLNFLVRWYDLTSCFILGKRFLSHNYTQLTLK